MRQPRKCVVSLAGIAQENNQEIIFGILPRNIISKTGVVLFVRLR
ncbi:Hypothetical protein GbCGDNIH1_8002 [Granulibacter bethesdensis CGDNIH1]|uniref:Uncharacterized protein n=1 Tax=Granulibacter bethesdensis (strain ATCC BAA-1260 / CGDNIH1) TaxID=391165 RepID=A0A286M2T5_GRABC|nr:Hypothetical protein GbCGDNIH5_8002 [Granulibacter bethesdensis]APH63405.1 Hypothetical protein GbCGDNIH1I4_8002 [Granulibacter bethesdensis]ASV62334.1 Hypothetical protein GbCGDNIH1_8002 [Granulibacter bethesdensis CGDNIH1]